MKIALNIMVSRIKLGSSHSGIVSIQAIVKAEMNLPFLFMTGTFKTAQCSGCQQGLCSIQLGRKFCVYNFVGTKNVSENEQENNVQLHYTRQSRLSHAILPQICSHHTLSLQRHPSIEKVPISVWLSTGHQSECRIAK
jgi:hypothetical protein